MTDSGNLVSIVAQTMPDEIYNLAAQSHVKVSFEMPEYTANCDALGTLRLLEAIRACGLEKKVKFYQASTSELYGKVVETPQKETTPFYPRSPYGVAKLYSYWITVNYRESYDIFAVNGILFNHESPRRGETFVTRKVTMAAAKIAHGVQECLYLGNIDSKRDWGHAKDYVYAMWLMLHQKVPEDYCIASGEMYTVREMVELSFKCAGITIEWKGQKGTVNEYAVDVATGKTIVKIDKNYFRPAEVDLLLGDPTKAQNQLQWKRKVTFSDLIKEMVAADMEKVSKEKVKYASQHFQ